MKVAIHCTCKRTGRKGTFLYDETTPLVAVGRIYKDCAALFDSEEFKASKHLVKWK